MPFKSSRPVDAWTLPLYMEIAIDADGSNLERERESDVRY